MASEVSLPLVLQLYPPEDILTASNLLTEYRPDLILEMLADLSPINFRYAQLVFLNFFVIGVKPV